MKLKAYALCALLLPTAASCAQDTFNDESAISNSLELENGGLDMQDEAPLFGEADLFESADLPEEAAFDDPISQDLEVTAMQAEASAKVVHASIRWGQLPIDLDNRDPRDWSGTFSVNRGAMLVRKTVAFETNGGDSLSARSDRKSVEFSSTTSIANDGIRLTIIDPTPEANEPLVLTYLGNDGTEETVALENLSAEPQSIEMDDAGNRLAMVAIERPVEVCDYGLLRGRWHKVARRGGRLLGEVSDGDGDVRGHMKGVYGQRVNGERVFFGKYVDTDGTFKGIFAGKYRNGRFAGLWHTRDGSHGALGGAYRETAPGPEVGGLFRGRWAAGRCGVNASTDMP